MSYGHKGHRRVRLRDGNGVTVMSEANVVYPGCCSVRRKTFGTSGATPECNEPNKCTAVTAGSRGREGRKC